MIGYFFFSLFALALWSATGYKVFQVARLQLFSKRLVYGLLCLVIGEILYAILLLVIGAQGGQVSRSVILAASFKTLLNTALTQAEMGVLRKRM